MFSSTKTDPVTGRKHAKAMWQVEVQARQNYDLYRRTPPFALDEAGLGSGRERRMLVGIFLGTWVKDECDEELTTDLLKRFMDMDDFDLQMLLENLPVDPRSKDIDLPEASAVLPAVRAIPENPDSIEYHRWRFENRTPILQRSIERLQQSATAGGGDTSGKEAFVDDFRAGIAREVAAEFCGEKTCQYCTRPEG